VCLSFGILLALKLQGQERSNNVFTIDYTHGNFVTYMLAEPKLSVGVSLGWYEDWKVFLQNKDADGPAVTIPSFLAIQVNVKLPIPFAPEFTLAQRFAAKARDDDSISCNTIEDKISTPECFIPETDPGPILAGTVISVSKGFNPIDLDKMDNYKKPPTWAVKGMEKLSPTICKCCSLPKFCQLHTHYFLQCSKHAGFIVAAS
jgi:hypothetical protein